MWVPVMQLIDHHAYRDLQIPCRPTFCESKITLSLSCYQRLQIVHRRIDIWSTLHRQVKFFFSNLSCLILLIRPDGTQFGVLPSSTDPYDDQILGLSVDPGTPRWFFDTKYCPFISFIFQFLIFSVAAAQLGWSLQSIRQRIKLTMPSKQKRWVVEPLPLPQLLSLVHHPTSPPRPQWELLSLPSRPSPWLLRPLFFLSSSLHHFFGEAKYFLLLMRVLYFLLLRMS